MRVFFFEAVFLPQSFLPAALYRNDCSGGLKGDPSDFFFMSGRGLQTLYVCFTSFNSDHLAASLISSFLDPLIRHLITYFGTHMIFFVFF